MSDERTGDGLIPDAVIQKQIGVVTELQDMLSEQARDHSEAVNGTAEALYAAIGGLTMLDHAGEGPAPIFDADALADAIEAGVEANLDAREAQRTRDAGEQDLAAA